MKRHSSNSVKMLKMATSAIKHTMKLSASERNSVASIRLGNPNAEKPRFFVWRVFAETSASFALRGKMEMEDTNGSRLTKRNNRLRPKMKNVASHGPT